MHGGHPRRRLFPVEIQLYILGSWTNYTATLDTRPFTAKLYIPTKHIIVYTLVTVRIPSDTL